MTIDPTPPAFLQSLLEDAFRKKTTAWLVPDCGLSAAHRFTVCFDDDSRVFVKAATDDDTEEWLRTERLVLSSIREKFAPGIIDWIEPPGERPVLITQDLSHAHWPASHSGVDWRKGEMELLLKALRDLSTVEIPVMLPALENPAGSLWSKIAAGPESFINVKLCSARWFADAIDALIQAEKRIDLTGNTLNHGDVRSDNLCIVDGQVILVDWSHAAIGNKDNDLATLLPTLYLEGGPMPYQVMPDGASQAAMQAAAHFRRLSLDAGLPHWLKNVFRKLIAIELEWAAACLGLQRPDGLEWQSI